MNVSLYWDDGIPEDFDERVRGHWLRKWYCTDTWVGLEVISFDGKPIAVTWQQARKCDKEIFFVSVEIARDFRKYLLSAEKSLNVQVINPEETIAVMYHVEFTSELLAKNGFYKDQPVEVSWASDEERRRARSYDPNWWQKVRVKLPDGSTPMIPIQEFLIPIGTKNELD
jgi:hypothetical protein